MSQNCPKLVPKLSQSCHKVAPVPRRWLTRLLAESLLHMLCHSDKLLRQMRWRLKSCAIKIDLQLLSMGLWRICSSSPPQTKYFPPFLSLWQGVQFDPSFLLNPLTERGLWEKAIFLSAVSPMCISKWYDWPYILVAYLILKKYHLIV